MAENSYKTIFKTSGLIGGIQVFGIFLSLLRNKVASIILGTSGFGIMSLFYTYQEIATSLSNFGIEQSGVKSISQSSDNERNMKISVFALLMIMISILICFISILFCKEISLSLFETDSYSFGIAIFALSIIIKTIGTISTVILNALRYIKDIVYANFWGSLFGSLIYVFFIYFYNINGIAFAILSSTVISSLILLYRLKNKGIKFSFYSFSESKQEFKSLIYIGSGFGFSVAYAALCNYLSKMYLSSCFDLSTIGIYQSSWVISNLYVGIIINAMGVDFMPRIAKLVDDKTNMKKLMNEQMELGFLFASVGTIAIILFSPIIIQLLYTAEFSDSVIIMRWQIIGTMLRVLGMPLSYAIIVNNKPKTYLIGQISIFTMDLLLLILFSTLFGFNGLGVNYCLAYILYVCLNYYICGRLFNFKFSPLLKRMFVIVFVFILISFVFTVFNSLVSYIIAFCFELLVLVWAYKILKNNMHINLSSIIHKLR